jgi:hypothetical protein
MAADLITRKVAVILVGGYLPGVRAVMAATRTIPIVFTTNADPVAARVPRAPTASSPRTCHPDHNQRAAVLGAVKAGLETTERAARPERRPTLTAPARAGLQHVWVGGGETGFQVEQRNRSSKKGRKITGNCPGWGGSVWVRRIDSIGG